MYALVKKRGRRRAPKKEEASKLERANETGTMYTEKRAWQQILLGMGKTYEREDRR